MPKNVPRPEDQHPPEYAEDLNPQLMAGRNVGLEGAQPAKKELALTAADIKEITRRWPDLDDDQLRSIPIVPRGARLQQGAAYFDLRNPQRGEIVATAGMEAGPDNWYAPKSEVNYQLWNIITGVRNLERLGLADEGETRRET